MNLSNQEAIYAGLLGAFVGVVYTVGRTAWWGTGTLADVAPLELMAAACVGAVAGIAAFLLRPK